MNILFDSNSITAACWLGLMLNNGARWIFTSFSLVIMALMLGNRFETSNYASWTTYECGLFQKTVARVKYEITFLLPITGGITRLVAGAIASNAFTGVAIGVGFIFASLVYSISRNPSQRDELLRFSFIGFSLVEASGLIGLVMSFILLFGL